MCFAVNWIYDDDDECARRLRSNGIQALSVAVWKHFSFHIYIYLQQIIINVWNGILLLLYSDIVVEQILIIYFRIIVTMTISLQI